MMKRRPKRRKKLVNPRKKKSRFEVSKMNLDAVEYGTRTRFGGCHCKCCRDRYGYKQPYKKMKRLFRRESAYISR
jgi:hypothetical protein